MFGCGIGRRSFAKVPRYNDTVPDVLKDVLALLPSAVCAAVAFFLSFGVSGALGFNLAAAAGAFATSMWLLLRHSQWRTAVTSASTACLIAIPLLPIALDHVRAKPAPATDELVRQIARVCLPLDSVDDGSGFADLEPLRRIWAGSRVVALGEATHGTSEFFRMKHRLTRFLVTQMGFRHVAMELDPEAAAKIDAYIQGGSVRNPTADLSWPWAAGEVAAMVDWMRKYNQSAPEPGRLHFHGIDYQGQRRDFRMARNTLDLLEDVGPGERIVLWAHNSHVSGGPGWMGSYLKTTLAGQIYLAGFEFDHGRFTSKLEWVRTYEAEPADSRFYASALNRTGRPMLFLDFRSVVETPAVEAWLQQARLSHDLAEAYGILRFNPSWVRDDESWPTLYDGIIYIRESTPAHQL